MTNNKARLLIVLALVLIICTMTAMPAFACTGYDPCPDGVYGNGDPNTDIIGWVQILMDIWWW